MYEEILKKKCIVRSYDAGVYYGIVVEVDGEAVKMENVRNIWHWEGANCLADVATKGIKDGKVSRVVSSMVLNRCCQIIPCTDNAIVRLDGISVWTY
jgi:hypothetical protein